MVYSRVFLIQGAKIDKSIVCGWKSRDKFIEVDGDEIDEDYSNVLPLDMIKDRNGFFLHQHNTHCCTDESQYFVAGEIVQTYHRNWMFTTKRGCAFGNSKELCEEFACCDDCFGLTENGKYDVKTLSDRIYKVKESRLCSMCFHHNRERHPFCERCKAKMGAETHPWRRDHLRKIYTEKGQSAIVQEGFFLMLDDCVFRS